MISRGVEISIAGGVEEMERVLGFYMITLLRIIPLF